MRRIVFIMTMLLFLPLAGQEFTLLPRKGGGGLAIDLDYLWRYNLYEHSRWGLGLSYSADTWHLVGNAGYGLRDRQLKWGVGASKQLSASRGNSSVYLMACREYSAAGNRRMQSASLSDFGSLSSFMTLRMSDQLSAITGYRWHDSIAAFGIDLRVFRGGRLFRCDSLLYRCNGDTIDPENGLELSLIYHIGWFSGSAVVGRTWPAHKLVAQLLVQSDNTFSLQPFTFNQFAQAGITPPNTPYIYMFNLGGTLGSPLYFRHSLLTAHPCEYTASLFVLSSSFLRLSDPLFTPYNNLFAIGTAPRPFIGLTAAWGHLWGQDVNGHLEYESLDLQAPNRLVAEAIIGIDGLLRWGYVDYGCAVAMGFHPLFPSGSTICQPRWAVMVTAELKLQQFL